MLVRSAVSLAVDVAELIFVFTMRAGRNWARWTLTVLLAVQLATIFASGLNPVGGVIWIIAGVALLLMWLPASNPHFRRG